MPQPKTVPRKLINALAFALAQARPDGEGEGLLDVGARLEQWDVDVLAVSLAIEAATGADAYAWRCRCQQSK